MYKPQDVHCGLSHHNIFILWLKGHYYTSIYTVYKTNMEYCLIQPYNYSTIITYTSYKHLSKQLEYITIFSTHIAHIQTYIYMYTISSCACNSQQKLPLLLILLFTQHIMLKDEQCGFRYSICQISSTFACTLTLKCKVNIFTLC